MNASIREHLNKSREGIIARWHQLALEDNQSRTADSLSFRQFKDHIPSVLDLLEDELDCDQESQVELDAGDGEELALHGFHRWQQGYRLSEVVRDWALLHAAVIESIDQFLAAGGKREEAHNGMRCLSIAMHHGTLESAHEFERLKSAEAKAQLDEIEKSIRLIGAKGEPASIDVSRVIHDMRQEVSLLAGTTKLFESNKQWDDDMIQCLRHGVSSLESMMADLITLTRLNANLDQLSLELVEPNVFMKSIAEKCRSTARTLGISLVIDGDFPEQVQTDPLKLTRVVQNLILNAFKHSRGTTVAIKWGPSSIDGHWDVHIADSSRQVLPPPEHSDVEDASQEEETGAENWYASFLASDPNALADQNDGLGLSIVKKLGEILNASLELSIDEDEDYETVFTVRLPIEYSN